MTAVTYSYFTNYFRIINASTSQNQFLPDVVTLDNGRFVVTFGSDDPNSSINDNVLFRRFSSDQQPLDAADRNVNGGGGSGDEALPSVARLANGNFVVVNQDNDNGSDYDIKAHIYTADGTLVAANRLVPAFQQPTSDERDPQVAGLALGGFVVVYANRFGAAGNVNAEFVIFDDAGTAVTGPIAAGGEGHTRGVYAPAVAALSNGDFVVAFEQENSSGSFDTTIEVFSPGGVSRTGEIVLGSASDPQPNAEVTALPNGRFAVVWEAQVSASATGVRLELAFFEANGVQIGARIAIDDARDADIATVGQNLVMVSYTSHRFGTDELYGRVFEIGNPLHVDLEFQLAGGPGDQKASAIASAGNGTFVAVWQDWIGTGDRGYDIAGRIGQLRRTTTGDDTDEVLTGDDLPDIIFGNGGNDVILVGSGGGGDVIFGGAGQDSAVWTSAREFYEVTTFFDPHVGDFRTFVGNVRAPQLTDSATGVETFGFAGEAFGFAGIQQNATANVSGGIYNDAIFSNASTGRIDYVSLDPGAKAGFGTLLGALPPGWAPRATGDTSENGAAEILIQDPSGIVYRYDPDGGWEHVVTLTPDWTVRGLGDFTRDGVLDPLIQRTDGLLYFFDLDRSGGNSGFTDILNAPGWTLVGIGDLDRDGASDLVIQNDSDGTTYYANIDGGAVVGWGFVAGGLSGTGWRGVGVGDLDGDGFDDVVFRNVHTGQIWAVDMLGGTNAGWYVVSNDLAGGWVVDAVLDKDNDGFDDVFVRQVSDGSVYAADMDAGVFTGFDPIRLSPGAEWSLV